MRVSLAIVTVLVIAEQRNNVRAFSELHHQPSSSSRLFSESAESAPAEKKPLTSADILARARKAAGMPEEEIPLEGPQLFDEDLLDDMQQSLLTLEKRAKGGPGSISLPEVEEFQEMAGRILKEMKEKEQERLNESSP